MSEFEIVSVCNGDDDDDDDETRSGGGTVTERVYDTALKTFGGLIHPPPEEFRMSYEMLIVHQTNAWNAVELDPSSDADSFYTHLSPKWQRHYFAVFSVLMWGDSMVLEALENDSRAMDAVVSPQVQAMFASQAERERVHQIVYAKMVELSDDSEWYRSPECYRTFLGGFAGVFGSAGRELPANDGFSLKHLLFYVMMCETVLFAPCFLAILYLSTTNAAPKICEATELVRRDERIHYEHARRLLASFRDRLDKTWARNAFERVRTEMRTLIDRLFDGDNEFTDDGLYSKSLSLGHFEYVCEKFLEENDMFFAHEAVRKLEAARAESPCAGFADLGQKTNRTNPMERRSTVYNPILGDRVDYLDFDELLR